MIFDGVVVNGIDCYVLGDKHKTKYTRCYKVDNVNGVVLESNITIEYVRKSLSNGCSKVVALRIKKGEE